MKIFTVKSIRTLFLTVTALLLLLIVVGQLAVISISDDFKIRMINHDYSIAGYLDRNRDVQTVRVFTSEKAAADTSAGRKLLQAAAYDSSVPTAWMPEVNSFRRKYSLLVFICTAALSLAIFAVLLVYSRKLVGKLDQANADISRFMEGDQQIRLEDRDEGSIAKLFASVNNMATSLTAHVSMEQQNKEFLRDTISDISHQLKTPLAALQMYNEILRDEKTGKDMADSFIAKSGNELSRMESLVGNLLKLAELDANAVELDRQDCNLRELLEQSLQSFHTRAQTEEKSLALSCSDRITLNCDADWLLEAISNIIKNALDHTDTKGTIAVTGDETPVMTSVIIKDTGKGIHPDDLHYIFKRFYRSRFSKDRQGVGIGLTLSKSIIEKHGGTILVESEPGKGSVFQLVFPKLTNV
jgi:signal transduction histidine kinase